MNQISNKTGFNNAFMMVTTIKAKKELAEIVILKTLFKSIKITKECH